MRPALELAEMLRSGQVHARVLVEAALVRLEEQEGHINAFGFVDAERALAAAETISRTTRGLSPACRSP